MSKRQILVVANDVQQVAVLVGALEAAGFQTLIVTKQYGDLAPDLALVDVAHGDLWAVAERLAKGRLIVLVRDAAAMRRGFALGAEDCVLADAHPDEVVARCEAVLRRTQVPQGVPVAAPAVYVDRRLWVNFDSHQVWVGDRAAALTPREFRLLEFLIRHRDRTLNHDEILAAVWERPPESERPTEVLKQYVWRLRQKIERDPDDPELIVTDAGSGYRFVADQGR